MNAKEYNALTDKQRDALKILYHRDKNGAANFLEFIKPAHESNLMGCVMVPWCGMQVGIETDGYTHS